MTLPLPVRADILKTLMLEDRQEIRTIRLTLYHIVSVITVASFAMTSFLADSQLRNQPIYALIDTLLLLMIWVVFGRLHVDLRHARQCQALRERLVVELDDKDAETKPFLPFQPATDEKVGITDSELKWLPLLASAAILAKVLILLAILPQLAKA